MARIRTRFRRFLALLVALLVLLLLLQLNQWLPGVWKGGGEGGFRSGGEFGLLDPRRADQGTEASPAPESPERLDAPTEPPADWPPKEGLLVRVRAPGGEPLEDWRLGLGSRGPERGDVEGGALRVRDRQLQAEGFRVRRGGELLRHRHGLALPATEYVVHVPAGEVPRVRRPAPVTVRVVDPETGAGVAGARLLATGAGGVHTTDAEGRVELPPGDGEPYAVQVEKPGHVTRTAVWIRPRAPEPVEVALPVELERTVTFRWADRRPASIRKATVRGPDGAVLARIGGGGRTPDPELTFRLPADALPDATITVEPLGTDVHGLRVTLPLAGLGYEVLLPSPRTVRIVVRDVQGRPLDRAQVLVGRDPGEGGPPLPERDTVHRTTTNLRGEADVSLLPGEGCWIVVQKGGLGPAGRILRAVDGSDAVEFVLAEGVHVPVRVTAPGLTGRVHLHARSTANGVRVDTLASAVPDEDAPAGERRLRVGPVQPGPVELFVHAPGHAPGAAVVDARPAMGRVAIPLEAGHPLRIVVEDAYGVPLAGARAEVEVVDGEPMVMPPGGLPGAESDAQGLIGLRDLPDRRYDVRITAPGHGEQRLRRVRPGGAVHFVTLLPAE